MPHWLQFIVSDLEDWGLAPAMVAPTARMLNLQRTRRGGLELVPSRQADQL